MKKIVTLCILLLVMGLMTACGTSATSGTEEEKVSTQDFIRDVAASIEARWDLVDENEASGVEEVNIFGTPEYQLAFQDYTNAELLYMEKYSSAAFEDSDLQALALRYIQLLNEGEAAVERAGTDYAEATYALDDVYDERAVLIKKLVDDYGLTVSEKHQESMEQFLAMAEEVEKNQELQEAVNQIARNLTFELVSDADGQKTYQAVVENTTGMDIDTLDLQIVLLNDVNETVSAEYASVSDLAAGQTAAVEFSTGEDFSSTVVRAQAS